MLFASNTKEIHDFITWNIFGALDLFVAVGTAAWLTDTRPGSMDAMLRFPLLLVPLRAVPFMLTTHAAMLRRAGVPVVPSSGTPVLSA